VSPPTRVVPDRRNELTTDQGRVAATLGRKTQGACGPHDPAIVYFFSAGFVSAAALDADLFAMDVVGTMM
jgi:hypothetical protein